MCRVYPRKLHLVATGFATNEVKKPYKDTLRMYVTLYSKGEVFMNEQRLMVRNPNL